MHTHPVRRSLRAAAGAAVVVGPAVWLLVVGTGAHVEIVMKAAGIPSNATGLGGFVNGAHALVTPALVMVAAIAPLALIVGAVSCCSVVAAGCRSLVLRSGCFCCWERLSGFSGNFE